MAFARSALATIALACAGCASSSPALVDSSVPYVQAATFVLIGEVHDNAEQHRLRAELLTRVLADGRKSTVVFEQIDLGHDEAIAAAPHDAESIATAGRLDRKGWAWPLHRPLIDAALAGGATIRGGNLDRDAARNIVRGGAASISAGPNKLMAASNWRDADEADVERDIDAGHCGALPQPMWAGMALAQRARDATLADTMLAAARTGDRVVLIAGNGHVRRDLGVPRYLVGAGVPAKQIVSIGFLEGDAGESAPPKAPYDLIRITPAADRSDPCEDFRKPASKATNG